MSAKVVRGTSSTEETERLHSSLGNFEIPASTAKRLGIAAEVKGLTKGKILLGALLSHLALDTPDCTFSEARQAWEIKQVSVTPKRIALIREHLEQATRLLSPEVPFFLTREQLEEYLQSVRTHLEVAIECKNRVKTAQQVEAFEKIDQDDIIKIITGEKEKAAKSRAK